MNELERRAQAQTLRLLAVICEWIAEQDDQAQCWVEADDVRQDVESARSLAVELETYRLDEDLPAERVDTAALL